MKKFLIFLGVIILAIVLLSIDFSGKASSEAGRVLTIFNVEDYISNGDDESVDLIAKFEEEYDCTVNYYTYDTNETMYNQFTLQKEGTYDLICTSDYMIQRMIKEGLVEKFEDVENKIPNYYNYASKVLTDKLKTMEIKDKDGNNQILNDYAVGYMWGTLGLIYDSEYNDGKIVEDIQSWDILYNPEYNNTISLKNSMRDAYVAGLMYHYSKEADFKAIMNAYIADPSDITIRNQYNQLIQQIFDLDLSDTEEANAKNLEKIEAVKQALIKCKDNIFGFEVDSGKNDIITGKIKINMAYSGDAVYSITTGREDANKELQYFVPLDGSNIWYDAWTLPKGSQNRELAYEFLNFLSDPANASSNMDYIGYTPYIVGDELLTMAASSYGACDYLFGQEYYKDDLVIYNDELFIALQDCCEIEVTDTFYFESLEIDFDEAEFVEGDMASLNGVIYNCIKDIDEDFSSETFAEYFEENAGYDVSSLFEGTLSDGRKAIIYPYLGYENQLETQYPSDEIIARCAVMNDFGDYNAAVIIMWGQVKAYTDMRPFYVILIVFVVIFIGVVTFFSIRKAQNDKFKRNYNKELHN